MTTINSTSQGTDHQSGYFYIPLTATVTISPYKQMVVFGPLTIDGSLNLEGQLILEP